MLLNIGNLRCRDGIGFVGESRHNRKSEKNLPMCLQIGMGGKSGHAKGSKASMSIPVKRYGMWASSGSQLASWLNWVASYFTPFEVHLQAMPTTTLCKPTKIWPAMTLIRQNIMPMFSHSVFVATSKDTKLQHDLAKVMPNRTNPVTRIS